MGNQLQNPFSDIIGQRSPVQKVIKLNWRLAIEDATDCFAAVGINANAAIKWQEGKLKSSDAAKLWTSNFLIDDVDSSEYRKTIRTALNRFSHCTPEQTHWNIY